MKNKKNITISDVASAAGVSKTTVSRYLNNRTDLMSEKTKNRIEKMIELFTEVEKNINEEVFKINEEEK